MVAVLPPAAPPRREILPPRPLLRARDEGLPLGTEVLAECRCFMYAAWGLS